jgi:succinate dehydrogenase/fumarate reductase flavoprotein subunit
MTIGNDECISTDVLVLGGGLGGCHAAIKAAEEGAKVVLFEKGNIRRGGNSATGLHSIIFIHPDYNISYEEFAESNVDKAAGLCDEDVSYEFARDTLDRILDLERWGIKMRNDNGSFNLGQRGDTSHGNNAIWPPDSTSWHDINPVLAKKINTYPNVKVHNRTAAIGLLTRDGVVGTEVVGAVGLETRTGKFVTCKAKAVVLTTGGGYRIMRNKDTVYAPTRFVLFGCPTNVGEGQAMAYRAGADILNMEFLKVTPMWKDFMHWGIGPPLALRCKPIGGNGLSLGERATDFDLYKKTHVNAFNTEGPLYRDASVLSGYPDDRDEMQLLQQLLESEATSLAYLQWMNERGEDFKKAPVEMEWGPPISAAEYAKKAAEPEVNTSQVEAEKSNIIKAKDVDPIEGYSWIELEDRIRSIASDYGAFFTNDGKLERGLVHLERIKTRYLSKLYARNPREMLRASEVNAIFYIAEAHLRAALFRKESRHTAQCMMLHKTDYPNRNDENWLKHTVIRNVNGKMMLDVKDVKRLSKKNNH